MQRMPSAIIALIEHIEQHLDEPLTLTRLSRVACYSSYHLARQFKAATGVGLYQWIQQQRLQRAAYQLAFSEHSITDIALQSQYENSESFSRAFKQQYQQTPTQFRNAPQWPRTALTKMKNLAPSIQQEYALMFRESQAVHIVQFPRTHCALYVHQGAPSTLLKSVRHFIEYRKQHGLAPHRSQTFNIIYDDPQSTAPKDFRYGLAASIEGEVPENDFQVTAHTIPAGPCAKLRHSGSNDQLGLAIDYLYREWLPQSGETLRDYPCFIERLDIAKNVAEHEQNIDIYLPLKPNHST